MPAMANDSYQLYEQQGMKDGCASGNYVGGDILGKHVQDKRYYASNEHYKQAWDIHYERCKISQIQLNNLIGQSLNRGWGW